MVVIEHFFQEVIIPLKIGSFDISITNVTVSMFAGVGIFLILLLLLAARPKVVPGKRQVVVEMLINFVKKGMVYNMIGPKEGDKWFPLVAGVFIFILANNMIGLIPGTYTPTSNPVVPLVIALIVFLTVHITNLAKNGIKGYLRTYAPSIVPSWMYVIVVPIETIGAIAKPFSLFIRLMANMLAGHTILYVILGLINYFKSYYIAIAAVPFALVMTILELFVSAIQAYVFAILTALYIGEAVHPKH
ncbi:MAG: F0F1 ATP synthase subunit A [Actinobacteria bacterium]|nr:F0F1 ATP synthase subunit A [Actinomycetota bacterium]